MKSVFQPADKNNLIQRINKLSEESTPSWGKLSVGQMCEHCARVLEINAGLVEEKKPGFLVKLFAPMVRKMILGEKPYPKNSPTAPQLKVRKPVDFETGKERLLTNLNYFTNPENKEQIVNHPSKLYGKLTEAEKGWSQYKHINYHLNQFGV